MKFLSNLPFGFAIILFLSFPSWAALNNSVRVDRFNWMHAQTEHFDIYYDKKAEKLLPRMAHYLEKAWQEVGDKFHFHVKGRTPFFFFSDHNIFEENNIVPVGEGTGGVTEAFKNRLLIFNDGSEEWLCHVIPHEFTHVVQFNILYGGFWKSVRLLKSPFYALWVMEGAAEYGAGDIDEATGDMVIRDAVYTKTLIALPELQGFNHVKPNQVTLAYKTGEAAIQFLADEYGSEKVGQFIATMENYFDVSSTLEQLLGTDLNRFDLRFHEWLDEKYAGFFDRAKPPTFYGQKLTQSDKIPQFNEAPAVSKDGRKIYYFSDGKGPTRIFEYDVKSKKSRVLIGLEWSRFENLHPEQRGLSLSRDGKWLAFSGEKAQRDYLYLLDVETKKLNRIKVPFDQIRSPVFSPVDDTLVVVGMIDGYNDLYLLNQRGEIVKRLTNNPQDERDPVFSPDGKRVVYGGEVMTPDGGVSAYHDLYDVSLEDPTPRRLLVLDGEERDIEVLPDGSLIFVRDRNDLHQLGYNLYHWDSRDGKVEQLTDMIGGAFSPRYSAATDSLYYVGFFGGEKHLYDFSASTLPVHVSTPIAAKQNESVEKEASIGSHENLVQESKQLAMTQAMNTWSEGLTSPLLEGQIKPYRWKGSTDLFLPFLFYSSLDGFVVADIWQYSDYLGNHQLQQQMQMASGSNYIDLSTFYTYARFRPNFTLGVRAQRFYADLEQLDQQQNVDGIGLMDYPLDRTQSLSFGLGANRDRELFLDGSSTDTFIDDRYWVTTYMYDTVTGRYLVPTQGQRLSIYYQQAEAGFNGNQLYKSGGLDGVQYFPIPGESAFAARLFYSRSVGRNPQEFRLGGIDRIRTVSSSDEERKKHNVLISSAELRYRLAYLNTRTKWLYPDFFFKAAYLVLFDDYGYGWNSNEERDNFNLSAASNSAGVGVFWPTFIIQSFQLNLGFQYAVRTTDGTQIWYITLGPTF